MNGIHLQSEFSICLFDNLFVDVGKDYLCPSSHKKLPFHLQNPVLKNKVQKFDNL